MNAKERLEKLKSEGKTVYSFSRLGTFNNCQFEYYNTYVLKNRGIDNCYTLMGSEVHDSLEGIYSGEINEAKLKTNYFNKLNELEVLGINFPNEKIKNSWVADMNHFVNNFNKIESKMRLEELIVFEVKDGLYMQGYVDAILASEKGKPYVNVYDWKTSSKFSGKKLQEAGRQLLMYKFGLEQTTPMIVDKVMWFMVKYIYVCSMQKNGKMKRKMCNRGKWVKEIMTQVEKELHKLDIDEFEREMIIDKALQDNSLECMPKEIQDKYWLEDCVVEYEITDEKIDELKNYIINTVNEIKTKNSEDVSDWKPREITKYDSFYCATLCGHRKSCQFYKKYLDENSNDFEKKVKFDDFDIFN